MMSEARVFDAGKETRKNSAEIANMIGVPMSGTDKNIATAVAPSGFARIASFAGQRRN